MLPVLPCLFCPACLPPLLSQATARCCELPAFLHRNDLGQAVDTWLLPAFPGFPYAAVWGRETPTQRAGMSCPPAASRASRACDA